MKKKLLSLALAMAICLSLTVPALAGGEMLIAEYVDGSGVVHDLYAEPSGDGWDFNADTLTLVLNEISGTSLRFYCNISSSDQPIQDVEIVLHGKNQLQRIQADTYNLVFSGDGSLDLTGKTGETQTLYCYYAITVNGGTLNASPALRDNEPGQLYYAVWCMEGFTINGGEVNLTSPDATNTYYEDIGNSRPVINGGKFTSWKQAAVQKPPITHTTPKPSATQKPPADPAGFTDIAADSPFKDAIAWAVKKGITKGTSATTFSPGNTCTHNHILTFLWRANGSPAVEGKDDFDRAYTWANKKALLYGKSFVGCDACTRSQTMMYLWKLAGSPKTEVNSTFTDVPADADYAQAVAWAVEQGITKGTTATTFGPDNTCTRGQIVTFLYRNFAK